MHPIFQAIFCSIWKKRRTMPGAAPQAPTRAGGGGSFLYTASWNLDAGICTFLPFSGHFLQSKRFIFVQSVQVCRNRAVFRHRAAGFAAGPFPAQRRAEAAEMRPCLVYRSWDFLAAGIDIRLCTGYNGWYTAAADFRQRRKGAHGSTAEYR